MKGRGPWRWWGRLRRFEGLSLRGTRCMVKQFARS